MEEILGIILISGIVLIVIAFILKGIADMIRSTQENLHEPL